MSDLISKSALLKRIGDEVRNQAELCADRNNLVVLAYADCYEKVQTAPTIDAVPVVRCKDCRWKEEEQPGMVYCPATVGGWVDEDWFCKGGERNEK